MYDRPEDVVLRRLREAELTACFNQGDEVVGTEYTLLGLLAITPDEQLESAGIARAAVHAAVERVLSPQRNLGAVLLGCPGTQTPRTKRIYERAFERAVSESRPVGLQDIWHALLSDPESVAVNILLGLELSVTELRRQLVDSSAG